MLRGLLLEEQLPSAGGPAGQMAAPGGPTAAQGAAADAGLPGAGLPPLAVRRPDLSHLYEDEGSECCCSLLVCHCKLTIRTLSGLLGKLIRPSRPEPLRPMHLSAAACSPPCSARHAGDYSGSPSFTDRQVYSPEPTPFHCPTCNVYCTSERLLEVSSKLEAFPGWFCRACVGLGLVVWPDCGPQHMQLPMRCLHLVCLAAGAPPRAQAPAACCWHRLPRRPPLLAQVRVQPA